jgi:hypothetical protein
MSDKSRLATAMAVAYVLGRFRKLRTAVLVGSALANENVREQGRELVQQGTDRIASSPEGQQIASNSTRLIDIARNVAITTIAARMDDISDRLAKRGESLQALQQQATGASPVKGRESSDRSQAEPEEGEQPEDEYEEEEGEEQPEDEYDEEEEGEEQPEDEYDEEEEGEEQPEDELDEEEGEEQPEDELDEEEGEEDQPDEDEAPSPPPPSSRHRSSRTRSTARSRSASAASSGR